MDALTGIAPVVLCGGASRRFGRDKLREVLANGDWLIDRPVAALRGVFGDRVRLVGACHESVALRHGVPLADPYPGVGPVGGIIAALEALGRDVFVLAGDMPMVTAEAVRRVAMAAVVRPNALAVLAKTDRVEPCFGVYRAGAMELLRAVMVSHGPLHAAVPEEHRALVEVAAMDASNVNTPKDLERG